MKLFADTANLHEIKALLETGKVHGVTTNPTIMRAIGVAHDKYLYHSRSIVELAAGLPVSLEVVADNHREMEAQARTLAALGDNVYVKLPYMTTSGDSTIDLASHLLDDGIRVNVTAVLTIDQLKYIRERLHSSKQDFIVSVFAGRIADTGRDPRATMWSACALFAESRAEILWASVREVYNYYQAEEAGCHIITMRPDLIKKMLDLAEYNLHELTLETVRQFYRDAQAAGFET